MFFIVLCVEFLFGSVPEAGPQQKLRHSCDSSVSVTHLVLVRGSFKKSQTCFGNYSRSGGTAVAG
jgi:hypothetical protein